MQTAFFSKQLKEWLTWVLDEGSRREGDWRWGEKVLRVAWLKWKWRNEELFGDGRLHLEEKLRQVTSGFEEDERIFSLECFQLGSLHKAHGPRV